jgi:ABC-type multidrug transport system permease subunit
LRCSPRASKAIYPIAIMAGWLKVVALVLVNPLTYLVDALPGQMIVGGESVHGFGSDFAVMALIFVVLSAWFYRRSRRGCIPRCCARNYGVTTTKHTYFP